MWGVQWDTFAVEAKQSVISIIPWSLPWSLPPLPPLLGLLIHPFFRSLVPSTPVVPCFPPGLSLRCPPCARVCVTLC